MTAMQIMLSIVAILSTVVVLGVNGTYNYRQLFRSSARTQSRLLTCYNDDSSIPVLEVQRNQLPHRVWLPVGAPDRGQDLFENRLQRFPAELASIFSDSPGGIDMDRQMSESPDQEDIDRLSVLTRASTRVVTIDEILPEDSSFFGDVSGVNITAIREFVDNSGIGRCTLIGEWGDLGERFFPRYFAGARCEQQSNCSIPAGQICRPDFQENPFFLNVLNWSCCVVETRDARESCGWRKVQIQILSFCSCGCN